MLKGTLIRRLVCAFAITIALGVGHTAMADPITPGFDLFATQPGTFANIPGIGMVFFMGGPPVIAETNVDTIVERLQGIDPFPVGGTGTISIILRELSLQSVAPVNIGGTFFDIFVTELPDQALGSMTVVHSTPDGGVFSSTLPVNALLTFMPVGGGASFSMTFAATLNANCEWSHTPPPGYPMPPQFPAGGFFPITQRCIEISATGNESHIVSPAEVPEPTALLLLASGLAGAAGVGRKRLSRKK
jgi:PEP-CTERM motif